ncbi:hypothetical protein MVEN_02217000 [Mycena venus]|uniref:NAD(P)-binding protein n=1 Tax=Mycena venus TaxID=2733690 RepID=A0A8H7CGM0_9AGAR|nr:hypothetical protein MVEN_02217000 [Mycena venus]
MSSLAAVEASNASFAPSYVPVAVIVGGTSGVGQAMAEALAHQTNGRARIVIIGRNGRAAARIIAGFPKPKDEEEVKHEFVQCDASSMKSVRAVCDDLLVRLKRINFLVITAGGPAANSLVESTVTSEGLDAHLAMRYFMRYLFTKSLLPLLVRAQELGQHAHVMSVLGAGHGVTIATTDLGLHKARSRSFRLLKGVVPSIAALKGMIRGVAYNDGLVAHFASKHPQLTFTHIHPGQVLTEGGSDMWIGWLLAPLGWVLGYVKRWISLTQDDRAKYMLYALLSPDPTQGGLYIRGEYGDVVSSHVFDADFDPASTSTTADKYGVLHGVPLKGYGGSDASVKGLVEYTEGVLAEVLG